jgi:hypothetical protein
MEYDIMVRENEILKNLNKDILKAAKKGDYHYYWDISGLDNILVKGIVLKLEKENKFIKNKGKDFKLIMW